MRKVTDFLARAGVSSTPETLVALTGKPQNSNRPDDSGKSTFANTGERIGGDNEALRHLLIDTGLQFGALDELKETFGKLVDPLHNLLSTLEQTKFDNASLRGALTELRSSHETLRSEFEGLEKKSSELGGDNHRLTRDDGGAAIRAGIGQRQRQADRRNRDDARRLGQSREAIGRRSQ